MLVEQVAEARRREALANTEQVVQTMVSEMSRRFNAEEEAASARMHQMMMLAESREGQYREELVQQGEVCKRVLDGNARQSNATKDQQIQALKDHYERQDESRRMQLSSTVTTGIHHPTAEWADKGSATANWVHEYAHGKAPEYLI